MTRASTPTTVSGFDRDAAMDIAAEELRRYAEVLEGLDDDQWAAPTECEPWTVRDMAGHVIGNHVGILSIAARLRQLWRGRRRGGNLVDALSANQVADQADLPNREVVAALRSAGTASIAARRRLPRAVRLARFTVPMHQGKERWSLAYVDDTIWARDMWMHRIDTCRAVGVEPQLSPAHDGVIVADIVREWALRHGEAYHLTLRGPAGGEFRSGMGEPIDLDAVEFCRLLSGRGHGENLLAVEVGY